MSKNKFQMRSEETFHRLMDKGIEVFLKKGYAKTSIDDAVKAAGYSRGAFYFHFKNKEDYFFHIMKYHDRKRGEDWSRLPYQLDPNTTSLKEVLEIAMISYLQDIDRVHSTLYIIFQFYNPCICP